MAKQPNWQPEEKEILKQNYPKGGSFACLPYLPARSKQAIRCQAVVMGLKAPKTEGGSYVRVQ